jgi:hypothetical protein
MRGVRLIKRVGEFDVVFGRGKFDNWCVYVLHKDVICPPLDYQYFYRLLKLGETYGCEKIYFDFIKVYKKTTKVVEEEVLELISNISSNYHPDSQTIELLFLILYAGMIAENNKEGAILAKRIKRLGMYQVLILKEPPLIAANFSKGKGWRELDKIMKGYGF